MTVTVLGIVAINESEPQALATYLEATMPLLDKVGAYVSRRFVIDEVMPGRRPATTALVVEYPDRKAVRNVFGSETYRSVGEARKLAFLTYRVCVMANENRRPGPSSLSSDRD